MSIKGRTKFAVAGVHPLLNYVRTYLISKGLALVPWEDDFDICLIGADIGQEVHPPLAQIELQKMRVGDKPVLLLSTSKASDKTLDAAGLYALAAEYIFGLDKCLSLRPYNVYGPDIHEGLIHDTIVASRREEPLLTVPFAPVVSTFLHQDDFNKIIDKLMAAKVVGAFDIGSSYRVSYEHAVFNVWQFVSAPEDIRPFQERDESYYAGVPNTEPLEKAIGWLPKTSVRSGIFKML